MAKSRSSIDWMMVGKSPPSNVVLPGPAGEEGVAAEQQAVPSTAKHIEPGVWPGVARVLMAQVAHLSTASSSRTKS